MSVEAPTGTLADALSTAAFVLELEHGQALVSRFPGCRATILVKEAGR